MNILFITADQWRGECLSALDHPVIKTPNLDWLASEGILFRQHYAQATPCSPSRTSLHTGMYMHNHRVCRNGTPFEARYTNWALEVGKAGYSPYLFGYTDTARDPRGMDPDDPRLKHYSEPLPGIETDTVYQDETPLNWIAYLEEKGYSIPESPYDIYSQLKPGLEWEDGGEVPLPLLVESRHHETRFMTEQCINWIGQQHEPWIAHLSFFRPHPPYTVPEPYNAMYPPADLDGWHCQPTPEKEAAQHPWLAYQLGLPKFRAPENPQTTRRLKASYYGLMSEVDDCLGLLFDAIRDSNQWDDTLVIFTSDHGEQMGDHWMKGKSGYFDSSYYIPLIIRDPREGADGTRGMVTGEFTENVDIMPTMLDWLGLDVPGQCDGHSLMPFLTGGEAPPGWRDAVHWEFDFRDIIDTSMETRLGINQHQCALNAIRDNRYKYVHFTALPPLFFDLENDPHEFNNLVGDPDYQGLVLEYAQKLISWRMNHDDRALTETFLTEQGPVTRTSRTDQVVL